jgi:hypothetical protein
MSVRRLNFGIVEEAEVNDFIGLMKKELGLELGQLRRTYQFDFEVDKPIKNGSILWIDERVA